MGVCYASSGDQPDSPVHDDAAQDRTHDDVQRNPIQSQRSAAITTGRALNKRHASVGIRRLDRKKSNKYFNKRWKNLAISEKQVSQWNQQSIAVYSMQKTNSAEKVKLKETAKIAETSAIPAQQPQAALLLLNRSNDIIEASKCKKQLSPGNLIKKLSA